MKKIFSAILVLTMVLALLAGCGSNSSAPADLFLSAGDRQRTCGQY